MLLPGSQGLESDYKSELHMHLAYFSRLLDLNSLAFIALIQRFSLPI
jgi:hypothetical protein